VRKLPSFRTAFAEQRCIVPADGFFERTGPKENLQPIWSHRSDGGRVFFAALYDSWRASPAEKERTFTIVTTAPNALLAPIHNRMPVILEEDAVDDWLYARRSPDSLMELLRPAGEDVLVATQVSARVNSIKNDAPECLAAP
jgi:putative SOS response-associated peptidase YedK